MTAPQQPTPPTCAVCGETERSPRHSRNDTQHRFVPRAAAPGEPETPLCANCGQTRAQHFIGGFCYADSSSARGSMWLARAAAPGEPETPSEDIGTLLDQYERVVAGFGRGEIGSSLARSQSRAKLDAALDALTAERAASERDAALGKALREALNHVDRGGSLQLHRYMGGEVVLRRVNAAGSKYAEVDDWWLRALAALLAARSAAEQTEKA